VTLSGTPTQVVNLTHIDNAAPGRRTLLSTAALQNLVEHLAAAVAGDAHGTGPHYGEGTFQGAGADSGAVLLPIHLVTAGPAKTPVPLANDPAFIASNVKVHFLDGTGQWQDATPSGASGGVTYEPGPPSRINLKWNSGLQAKVNYRLTVAPPFETPVVDAGLRPLSPGRLARNFRLALNAATNTLALDTSHP
jgi:hypothetical protein